MVLLPAAAPYRQPEFEVCLKPLIAAAPDEATLAERAEVVRARLAFYCSTPAYARAFAIYGLEDLCAKMAGLSKRGAWAEMAANIDDDLLHRFAVISRYDALADDILTRYADCIDRVEVSIPLVEPSDFEALSAIVERLGQAAVDGCTQNR